MNYANKITRHSGGMATVVTPQHRYAIVEEKAMFSLYMGHNWDIFIGFFKSENDALAFILKRD